MLLITRLLFLLSSLFIVSTSLAASFNCEKASRVMERLICSDPQLSALDESLSAAYKAVLSNAPDKKLIVRWQREWLNSYQVAACQSVACLKEALTSRIDLLSDVTFNAGTAAWNGSYVRYYFKGNVDRNSSSLFLMGLKDNQIYVSGVAFWYGLNAKNGQINDGEMDGIGQVSADRARFDLDGCKAEMVLKRDQVVVESESGCGGLNVTFVGNYRKK